MRYRFIEERASEMLKEKGYYSVPIDVIKLSAALGITLEAIETQDNVSGFFLTKGNKSIIGYNKLENGKRIRFTIGHEIGHWALHAKTLPLFIDKKEGVKLNRDDASKSGEIKMEREANAFAAALLMPSELVKQELDKLQSEDGSQVVDQLAKRFKVSREAMAYRLTNLDLIAVGL